MRQVFVLLAACGPVATEPVRRPAETVEVTAPTIARAEFAVAPAELGDKDVWTRIRHRVRVAKYGPVWFAVDGPRADESTGKRDFDDQPIFPVIGESGDKIRIVVPTDDARIAMWIARADAAATALAPVRVGDEHGRADKTSGIFLGAGADLRAKPAANGLRAITLATPYLEGSGYAPEAAIGEVWVAGERETYDPSLAFTSEPAPVETGKELAPGAIRVAPDAAVIATTKDILPVHVIAERGTWTEIEVHVPRVRVHGFVPASAVSKPAELHSLHGSGHGSGYGMSDTASIEVPDGACLYDKAKGDIIGVEDGKKVRYSHAALDGGFTQVYVGNEWGLMSVYVKDTTGGTDIKKASWEICKK